MNQEDLFLFARRQPFKPFRLTLSTGKVLEVRHPELIMVGRRSAGVGVASRPNSTVYDHLIQVDLIHIVTAEEVPEQNAPSNGTDTMTA